MKYAVRYEGESENVFVAKARGELTNFVASTPPPTGKQYADEYFEVPDDTPVGFQPA